MKTESVGRMPWLALWVLWSAYALLGWYLAAHHIIWIMGAAVIAVMLMMTGKETPILKQLTWLSSQSLFITIAISLVVTICLILLVTDFQFLGLIFLPAVATFWADVEMRSIQSEPHRIWVRLAVIASLGIAFGEAFDLLLIPSMRY